MALKELDEVYGFKRAFIVTDANLWRTGVVSPVEAWVRSRGIKTAEYFSFNRIPTFDDVRGGLQKLQEFQPDVIIGVGGGAVMSAAKAMLIQYENPEISLEELAEKHDRTDAAEPFPPVGNRVKLVLVTTSCGTGAECTPYAVLADNEGKKHVIASFELLPEIAVIDPDLFATIISDEVRAGALNVLARSIRAYLSEYATDYMEGFALNAVKGVMETLEDVLDMGPKNIPACDRMMNAAALSGIAISNSFCTINPDEPAYPTAEEKVISDKAVKIARYVGIDGETDQEVFDAWIAECERLAAI